MEGRATVSARVTSSIAGASSTGEGTHRETLKPLLVVAGYCCCRAATGGGGAQSEWDIDGLLRLRHPPPALAKYAVVLLEPKFPSTVGAVARWVPLTSTRRSHALHRLASRIATTTTPLHMAGSNQLMNDSTCVDAG